MTQSDIKDSVRNLMMLNDEYTAHLASLMAQDIISRSQISNLYGFAEGIASAQRIFERKNS